MSIVDGVNFTVEEKKKREYRLNSLEKKGMFRKKIHFDSKGNNNKFFHAQYGTELFRIVVLSGNLGKLERAFLWSVGARFKQVFSLLG